MRSGGTASREDLEERVAELTRALDAEHLQRRRLEHYRRKWELLFRAAGWGICVSDPDDGTIELVNPALAKLLDYEPYEMEGLSLINYLLPEERARFSALIPTVRHQEHLTFESVLVKRDGSSVAVLMDVAVSPELPGEPSFIVTGIQDVSEWRRADAALRKSEEHLRAHAEELARSNADLQQFAWIASHDLKEPLRMVTSYVRLLEKRYKDQLDAEAGEFIHYAVDGAARMHELINDLLLYSRVGARVDEFTPVDCDRVLDAALGNLKLSVDESGVTVTRGKLPTVKGDAVQIGQLFQNLVSNAIKFRSEKPPAIEIEAVRQGEKWLFSVKDNGIGIEPCYADRIFVIFQRLHTRDKYPGTGVGLAVCKRIVERHQGKIWVESQPGQGTSFFFTLPASL